MTDLDTKKCTACEGDILSLKPEEIKKLLQQIDGDWQLNANQTAITRVFNFKGFYKTMAFVNALAWIANTELHHPDLQVSYNKCVVTFTTHAINGLTENDFICAKKVDGLN